MSALFNMLGLQTSRRSAPLAFLSYQKMFFAAKGSNVPSQIFHDVNKNRYQESQMLFFGNKNRPASKAAASRPKTIAEIKKIQSFVQTQKQEPGKSLNASIKSMAKRDPSFNEFLKNFKAKNEQNWASIVDMTQEMQEEQLLAKSPEYRKNEMVMLEEFRRRKNLKDYFELSKQKSRKDSDNMSENYPAMDMDQDSLGKTAEFAGSGPERYFEAQENEVFDPNEFTLIFIASDSVTNVTSLNRVNHRRVLLFCGNGDGLISFGKGKGEDYENAFDQAFKKLRQNLVCISLDQNFTVPKMLDGRHNDFKIKIYPQASPNYWGNPHIWKMLLHSGFAHCRYVCKSRKRDPYSMVYAFFLAVTKNQTPNEIAQIEGKKLHQVSYGNPTTKSGNFYSQI